MKELDWLRKMPIVSVMIALAMIVVPILLGADLESTPQRLEDAREEARDYFVQNPRLAVDALGHLILGSDWLDETRAAADASNSSARIELPTRMLARSQAKLDGLIETAYDVRMTTEPAWRLGVLGAHTPVQNYFSHAFVHESLAGILLCVAVLLWVGIPLERSWGSVVFALFTLAAIPATAEGYRLLDESGGVPWSGGAGLAGALIGAYFIRGLGGSFALPGGLLLAVWLGLESIVVRGLWIEDLGSVPWATLCAAVGFGALVAGGLRLVGVESALESRASRKAKSSPNPIVSRAARLRSDGDPYQAFDLIQAAWRDNPLDREVAEAFFSMAVDVDEPAAAAEAILPSLEESLRAGDMKQALDYWIPIASVEAEVELGATAAIRLGEALLDAGQPELAIFSLHRAVDEGLSSAQALRIVHVARDLDEGLARKAATLALGDETLDPARCRELEAIALPPSDSAHAERTNTGERGVMPSKQVSAIPESPLARRVDAEHHAVEITSFPLNSDPAVAEQMNGGSETRLVEQNLDAGALSGAALEQDTMVSDDASRRPSGESGDVLSHWNDPGRVGNLREGPDPNPGGGEEWLGIDDLRLFEEPFDLGETEDLLEETDTQTDSDLTPLMDASEELTNRFSGSAPADELTVLTSMPRSSGADIGLGTDLGHPIEADGESIAVGDQPTVIVTPATDRRFADESEFAIGFSTPEVRAERPLRQLKAIEAIPVEQHSDSIEIDVDGRGKSKLPFTRVEAIVVAGISGLAARPILLVDFALNWSSDPSGPLKVIRIRSDRFDPRSFEPTERNPLEALTAWIRSLQILSEATCLPSRAILKGEFVRYESVEDYESQVLAAMREV